MGKKNSFWLLSLKLLKICCAAECLTYFMLNIVRTNTYLLIVINNYNRYYNIVLREPRFRLPKLLGGPDSRKRDPTR